MVRQLAELLMEAWLILILIKVIIDALSVKDIAGGHPPALADLCPSLTESTHNELRSEKN